MHSSLTSVAPVESLGSLLARVRGCHCSMLFRLSRCLLYDWVARASGLLENGKQCAHCITSKGEGATLAPSRLRRDANGQEDVCLWQLSWA